MESKFKVGDRVRLKSGGPLLVICSIENDGKEVNCCFFNNSEEFKVIEGIDPSCLIVT